MAIINAGSRLLAAILSPGQWQPMSFSNGWSNHGGGNVTGQYRLWPLFNEVEIIGGLAAGTITSGTVIATLPAGYTPADQQEIGVLIDNTSGGAGGNSPRLSVTTAGQLQVFNLPSGTTFISIPPSMISLDA